MMNGTERQPPRVVVRVVIGIVIFMCAWYLVSAVLTMFDSSVGKKAAVLLSVRSGGDSVQVSLQGDEWQRGETSLKLYPGDAIATRGSADVILRFFDGTRIRLDRQTDVLIDESDNVSAGNSTITLTIRSGRVWVATPSVSLYSGAILRRISTENFFVMVPSSAQANIASHNILVLKADGAGLQTDLSSLREGASLTVGEGQVLELTNEAVSNIKTGRDPYDYRDPITPEQLKDVFLSTSYAILSQQELVVTGSGSTSSVVGEADLIVTSPENNAHIQSKIVKVTGRVSERVKSLLVNGQSVPIQSNRTFSVEISQSEGVSAPVRIEAQDAQGITLLAVERTIVNDYKVVVDPVRIKSPVGSGETLTTNQTEIEITGEAPAATAAIMINDYKLMLYKSGDKTWSYLASVALGNLLPGKNVFSVQALDADGNKSVARSIIIDLTNTTPKAGTGSSAQPPLKQNPPLTPGVLSVQAPEAGTSVTTDKKEIVIEGQTSADTSSISINGYTLSLYLAGKTTWNYIASTELLTMKRGKNVYRVVARNAGGEILDVLEYTVNYKP